MNINKKNLFFSVFMIFIVAGVLFLSAENHLPEIEGISSQDFTYSGEGDLEIIQDEIVCKSGDCTIEILGKGGEKTIIEATQGIKVSPLGKISVTESGAEFSINGNDFKNINSGEIIFDQSTGKISEASFLTNVNGGTYDINGNKFNVPGDKEFVYPSKKGGFLLPSGTEVLKTEPEIRIETEGIVNYKGNKISGTFEFDKEGDIFISPTEEVAINGVSVSGAPRENVFVYFNSEDAVSSANENYVVLGDKAFEYKIGKNTQSFEVSFKPENPYLKNFEEDDLFGVVGGVLGEEGYLKITKGFTEGGIEFIPSIKTSGSVSILNDGLRLEPIEKSPLRNGEFILKDYISGEGKGAVETVYVSDMTETIQIGSVVDNKGRIFFTSNHKSGEPLAVRDLTRNSISKYSGNLELPLFPDIFSEEIRMSKSYVNLFDDKKIMALTRDYKVSDRGLKNFQNIERDKYLEAFQSKFPDNPERGTNYYNELREIVSNPELTTNDKTKRINSLIVRYKTSPPKIKASDQIVNYIRDISDFAFELEKREVNAPFRREDFLGDTEIKGIDKIMKDESLTYSQAFNEYHKRTGIEVGPRIMFIDTSIPVKTWIEALEF